MVVTTSSCVFYILLCQLETIQPCVVVKQECRSESNQTTSGQNISGNRQFITINSNHFLFNKAPRMILAEHTKKMLLI